MKARRAGGAAALATGLLALTSALALPACGEQARRAADGAARHSRAELSLAARFPTLENVRPIPTGPRTYDFMVMLRTPYASPSRHAAGWRVLTLKGAALAEKRISPPYLGHASFWRRQVGVRVPAGVRRVQFEARDSRYGYGGSRLTVTLP